MEKVLTTTEAAKRLGVTSRSILAWIQQGHLPNAYRLNPGMPRSPHRIPESDIVAFEKKRQRNPDLDQGQD